VCKVTIDAVPYGNTPVDAILDPGKHRIYCRMPTGSTRHEEIKTEPGKVYKVTFAIKQ
jgi:hypothetical protein